MFRVKIEVKDEHQLYVPEIPRHPAAPDMSVPPPLEAPERPAPGPRWALVSPPRYRRPPKKRRSLPMGVYHDRHKYKVLLSVNGKQRRVGVFHTVEEASAAYQKACKRRKNGTFEEYYPRKPGSLRKGVFDSVEEASAHLQSAYEASSTVHTTVLSFIGLTANDSKKLKVDRVVKTELLE